MDPQPVVLSSLPYFAAQDVADVVPAGPGCRHQAHAWPRTISRRRVMQAAAGAAGMAVGGALWRPDQTGAAQARGGAPRPIPGGIDLGGGRIIHIYDAQPGLEPSTITDFRGFVGISEVRGEGTVTRGGMGLGAVTATNDRLVYQANLRFMQGRYVAADGAEHTGTAAFI